MLLILCLQNTDFTDLPRFMSTRSRKRKVQKLVRESQSDTVKTKPIHDVVVSHDLPTNDTTLPSLLSKKPFNKSLGRTEKKCEGTKQSTDNVKNDVDPARSSLEDDIRWCIAQLEMAVVSRTVTKKQKEESIKYMKLLQSSKTPVPRKRQIMRQNFGDYKQKMKVKLLLDSKITVTAADSELMLSAGMFHRKSTKFQTNSCVDENIDDEQGAVGGRSEHSESHTTLKHLCKELESGSPFAFNFSID